MPTPTSPAVRATRGAASAAALAFVGAVVAVGGVAAWWFFGRAPDPRATTPTGPAGGKPYVAPTRMDPTTATLARLGDGLLLGVTLSGVGADDRISVRLRDGSSEPKHPLVFVDVGTPRSPIGVLEAKAAPTGREGERRLSFGLPASVERVTVIDLRSKGRWEGFELDAAPRR